MPDTKPSQTPPMQTSNLPIYTDVDKVPLTLLGQMSAHWRTLYEQRRKLHDVSIRQIVLGQIFTIVAAASLSILIEDNKQALLLVGSTLVLYPSITDLLVSNAAVLGASTHHDYDSLNRHPLLVVAGRTLRSIAAALLSSVIVGTVAGLLGILLFNASFVQTLQLAVLATMLASIVGFPLLVGTTFLARWLKSNPDEINPPIENTMFNILVLAAIIIASRIVL